MTGDLMLVDKKICCLIFCCFFCPLNYKNNKKQWKLPSLFLLMTKIFFLCEHLHAVHHYIINNFNKKKSPLQFANCKLWEPPRSPYFSTIYTFFAEASKFKKRCAYFFLVLRHFSFVLIFVDAFLLLTYCRCLICRWLKFIRLN